MEKIRFFFRPVVVVLLVTAICSMPVSAGLDDFKKGTEKEQKENKNSGSSSHNDDGDDDTDNDSFFGELFGGLVRVVFWCWAYANLNVRYAKYPYSGKIDDNFIAWNSLEMEKSKPDLFTSITDPGAVAAKEKEMEKFRKRTRPFYFTLSGGYQRTRDGVNCGFASLSGRVYKLIGPEFETRYYRDGKDYLSYTMLGANIPVFQWDYFSPDFYIGKAFMTGIVQLDGFAAGVNVTSYPFRPFVLHGRYGRIYMKNITYKEWSASMGVIYRRVELFAGYRSIAARYSRLRGFEFGTRLWM